MEEKKSIRIRSINETLKLIKKDDPNTSITYFFLKKLCESGEIKAIKSGNRFYINYDQLIEYLNKW